MVTGANTNSIMTGRYGFRTGHCRRIALCANDLSPSVQIRLNDKNHKRAKQIANYPWFAKKRDWHCEIELMLKNDWIDRLVRARGASSLPAVS